MGCQVRDWAWGQGISPMQKLVLLALVEHANEEGDYWSSEEGLRNMTGLSPHELHTTVQELETMGLILCLRLMLVREKRGR